MVLGDIDFSGFKLRLVRFYAYRAFISEGVMYPIITIYALSQGLSFADIGVATGTYFLGMLVGEIPTGYICDRIGRRNGLVVGAIAQSLVQIGFALSNSAIAFVVFYGIWGVAATFRSGSADAWLYDLLQERNATEMYTRIRGRGMGMYYGSGAITALFGGVLYTIDTALPFLAAAAMTALAAITVSTLPEPTQGRSETFELAEARESLEMVLTNHNLAAFTFLSGVLMSIPTTVDVFVQPISQTVGFTTESLGPLYAGLLVTASAGSFIAPFVQRHFGIARWFVFSPIVLVIALSATIPVHAIAIPIFFYSRLFNTTTATLGSTYLNERIESSGRATTLSGVSMVYGLLYFVARSFGGALAGETSQFISITTVGCLCLVLAFACSRIHDPFGTTK